MAKIKTGHISNIGKEPFINMLMGYVVGFDYNGSGLSEILLTKNGEWTSLYGKDETGYYKTRNDAIKKAKSFKSDRRLYTRGYIYSSQNNFIFPFLKKEDNVEKIYLD